MPALTVRVIRAKLASSAAVDSYAVLSVLLGDQQVGLDTKTHTFKNSLEPEWNTSLTWELSEQVLRSDLVIVANLFALTNGRVLRPPRLLRSSAR